MDKVAGELLGPVAKRLAAIAPASMLLFWALGLVLFHLLHPQPLPGCRSGGADLCGLLVGDWRGAAAAGVCLMFVMIASYVLLFSRAAEVTWFLSGAEWPGRISRIGAVLQGKARRRNKRRASADPPSRRAQARAQRFPHGTPLGMTEDAGEVGFPLEPTYLGNVFAAARQRISNRHGLRLDSCWSYLLAVLPKDVRADLEHHSRAVLVQAQAVMWSVMAMVWAALLPGAPLKRLWVGTALFAAYWFYRRTCAVAASYCDMLEAVIIANRTKLFECAGFEPPSSTAVEPAKGQQLSGYIDRHDPPPSLRIRRLDKGGDTA